MEVVEEVSKQDSLGHNVDKSTSRTYHLVVEPVAPHLRKEGILVQLKIGRGVSNHQDKRRG